MLTAQQNINVNDDHTRKIDDASYEVNFKINFRRSSFFLHQMIAIASMRPQQ